MTTNVLDKKKSDHDNFGKKNFFQKTKNDVAQLLEN
jgi:hypothetical protein